MLRQDEALQVIETFEREQKKKLIAFNAVDEYLDALGGVTDPEQKRKIIGWSMQSTMTTDIVIKAMMMAIWRRPQATRLSST
jgi:GMP synthase PP-ATPase subunit